MNSLIKIIKESKLFFALIGALGLVALFKETTKKKIFISFAIEDSNMRDLLVGQAQNSRSPFEFRDHSVYEPWDSAWKTHCREEIRNSDGVIALLSNKTWKADGQRWEIKCAVEEGIPIIGVHAYKKKDRRGVIPQELNGQKVMEWNWEEIIKFIDSI
jgi:hypothetical protein